MEMRVRFSRRKMIVRIQWIQTLALVLVLLAMVAGRRSAAAGDWPQILGPQRNGAAEGETLADSWPAGGPKLGWSYALGSGYAGPAVVGGRVVVFHRRGDVERIEALDAKTGNRLWRADFEAGYGGGVNSDTGPRCVPLIFKDRVVVFGAAGDLHCVALADGKKLWSRSLFADYGGSEGYFGAGSTPIAVGDRVLVNVGGRNDAGLAAFSLADGKTLWKGTSESASYSSPVAANFGGRQHVIFVTRLNAVSVDPADGSERFRFPFGARGPTVNAASPLVFDDYLFVSASYGVGARLSKVGNSGAEKVWANDDVMSSQYTTCVYRDGFLYGVDGREDIGSASLRSIEAKTGKVRWQRDGFGVAHAILAGDKLLLVKSDAEIVLAEATPDAYRQLAVAAPFAGSAVTTRALPALSQGRLYVRSSSGSGGQLKCLFVGKDK